MAASNGRKKTSSNKSTGRGTKKSTAGSSGRSKKVDAVRREQDSALFHEIGLIVLFVAMVILFCCNFGIIGPVGDSISGVLFGVFGLTAYVLPVLLFLAAAFWFANQGNPNAVRKLISGIVLFLMMGIVCDLLTKNSSAMEQYNFKHLYESCRVGKTGGGILAGSVSFFLHHYLETIGTVLVVLLCSVVSLILLTEKSLISSMKNSGSRMRERSREDAERRREYNRQRLEEQERKRAEREEERLRRAEEQAQEEEERIRRKEERLRGAEEDRSRRKEEEGQRSGRKVEWSEEEEQRSGRREGRSKGEGERSKREEERLRREEERRLRAEEKENEKILRMEKKVSGVMLDTALARPEETRHRDDIHEIVLPEDLAGEEMMTDEMPEVSAPVFEFEKLKIRDTHQVVLEREEPEWEMAGQEAPEWETPRQEAPEQKATEQEILERGAMGSTVTEAVPEESFGEIRIHKEEVKEIVPEEPRDVAERSKPVAKPGAGAGLTGMEAQVAKDVAGGEKNVPKKYMFPPLSRLQKGVAVTADTTRELKETAMHLQQTLQTFGVKVTITDISQGPSVTRYELQPEQGVKVSKIVGLSDDIKLNLAATDIRIEAPIPGKAAIGIEVPNKENMPVALRDLLETKEFREFPSNLAFAVGKDIGGKVVVSDIAKMPHMLIAGATGSGKSVCINTLIMSILYKAHPDDVKLIMVDPKVVELSVYNGIPHLLIPVVTDPKKASAALHWGVSEMEDRYRKFADFNVRDLKGYNKKLESRRESGEENVPAKLPQIVIIVDELADLMMVCPGEVEESICRLAQLARAAGIHLIIATQRPSVDVITGLIKANMPSRVAFSVSSGVDSRTILDMNGAERLLGKGDMLFYPQGYSKPARVQGAFVSDREVSDVVDFLKNQMLGNTYAEDIENKIMSMGSGAAGGSGSSGGGSDLDELFEKAGRLIIEQDKASIGMLQRAFRIGFNRAARIMDQLCQYSVVGDEEGTKPRKILMSPEQFEQLLEEI